MREDRLDRSSLEADSDFLRFRRGAARPEIVPLRKVASLREYTSKSTRVPQSIGDGTITGENLALDPHGASGEEVVGSEIKSVEPDSRIHSSNSLLQWSRRTKSFSEVDTLQRQHLAFAQTPLDETFTETSFQRRAHSHPGPRDSNNGADGNQPRRVNYLLLSRPVPIPEGHEKDLEREDLIEDLQRPEKKITKIAGRVGKSTWLTPKGKKKKEQNGVVVFKGHPSWSIVLAFQVGLRHTSDLLNSDQQPQELLEGHDVVFELKASAATAQNGDGTARTSTRWTHHTPLLYKKIREMFGISDKDFLDSVSAESKIRELPTPGKSGALFYVTEDEHYLIKTVSKFEERKLKDMLPRYYEHIQKFPDTMLTKFLASFSMKTQQGRHIRMIAMDSIFSTGLYIDQKYDLKGSDVGRRATESEKEKDFVTLKDLDMDEPVFFASKLRDDLLETLERDTEFLASERIMDYSVLLGLSEVLPGDKTFEDVYGPEETDAPWVLGYQSGGADGHMRVYRISIGIIDILQTFTPKKKVEFVSKTAKYCASAEVSVNPPSRYRRRFLKSMEEKLLPLTTEPPSLAEATRVVPTAEEADSAPPGVALWKAGLEKGAL